MFDARQLLEQVMNSSQMGDLGQMMRGATGTDTVGETALGARGPDTSQLMKGAVAGGLVGLLIGNRGTRRMLGRGAGTALKLGGLAAVGALAYSAWQRHKAGPEGAEAPTRLTTPPIDSRFAPEAAPGGADALARGVLVAMIQGAKADGHIDSDEQRRIFGHVETLDLPADAMAFVKDELAAPQDIGRVIAFASSPEVSAELYAASLLAMDPDTAAERAYLDRLARALALAPGLVRELESTVADGM